MDALPRPFDPDLPKDSTIVDERWTVVAQEQAGALVVIVADLERPGVGIVVQSEGLGSCRWWWGSNTSPADASDAVYADAMERCRKFGAGSA